MAKELPILPSTAQPNETEQYEYSRVFCQKDNSPPPLRLLLEFLQSRGQTPIAPTDLTDEHLDEWAWVHVTLRYDRNRQPIQVFCMRNRGTYKDAFEQEQKEFLELLASHDDIEAQLAGEYVARAQFILTTRFLPKDMTDEGYDFNGWILEFFQDQCNGIVQIDNQGFYSPKGNLIVEISSQEE